MSVSTHQFAPVDGVPHVDTQPRKATRSPPNDDMCCIYVHAGAGYHSYQNERIHLEACNECVSYSALFAVVKAFTNLL